MIDKFELKKDIRRNDKNLKSIEEKESGITLIALVITIIVILILAGVAISTLMGENGLINRTIKAKEQTEIAGTLENLQLAVTASMANENYAVNETDLKGALTKAFGAEGTGYKIKGNSSKGWTITVGNVSYKVSASGEVREVEPSVELGAIFDETGTVEGKLHIGDFINYTAGIWNDDKNGDMATIARTGVAPNKSSSLPTTNFQFGGFAVGGSRDGNATPYSTSYAYVQDKSTSSAVTGWRLFDVSDGVMTLISAGCPEDYYHPGTSNSAYISEYILTGNESLKTTYPSLGLGTTYKARDWNMYVNEDYGATGATALTKAKLDAWYTKYTKTANANTSTSATFQKIYKTDTNNGMYESLIDNYSYYWLSSAYDGGVNVRDVIPSARAVNFYFGEAFGVRVLVSLSSEVKLSDKATGTKTVESRGNSYPYNVWDLVTEVVNTDV